MEERAQERKERLFCQNIPLADVVVMMSRCHHELLQVRSIVTALPLSTDIQGTWPQQ